MAAVITAFPKTPPVYNGNLEYFIADLGPAYPCHPFFDSWATWFDPEDDEDSYKNIRDVLDGLSKAGFNAIRLPLWPRSE